MKAHTMYKFDKFMINYGLQAMIAVGALLIVGVIALAYYEGNEWEQFSQEHECKVVAHHSATTGYGLTSNGKMGLVTVPGTTTYRCNDGVDYTR